MIQGGHSRNSSSQDIYVGYFRQNFHSIFFFFFFFFLFEPMFRILTPMKIWDKACILMPILTSEGQHCNYPTTNHWHTFRMIHISMADIYIHDKTLWSEFFSHSTTLRKGQDSTHMIQFSVCWSCKPSERYIKKLIPKLKTFNGPTKIPPKNNMETLNWPHRIIKKKNSNKPRTQIQA